MRPSDHDIRIAAALIVAAGLLAAGVAIFPGALGVEALADHPALGARRMTLLVAALAVIALGVLLLARPRIAAPLADWEGAEALPPNWFGIGLVAQLVAGALVIGAGIGSAPFWFDEIASATIAERSIGDIFRLLANTDANMGLYYLLLHFWLWGGDSEAWIRAFSALAALAAVPATAILARRLCGDSVGLVAGFLMVGSMFVVQHAQNARAYALALLLITVATLFFVEAIRSRRPAHFLAYGASSVLAVYASPLTGLVLVAHAATLPLLPGARELGRRFVLTYSAMLLALAPFAVALVVVGTGQVSWIERPGLGLAADAAWEMLGADRQYPPKPQPSTRPLALAFGALIATGLLALWLSRRAGGEQAAAARWRKSLVASWMLVPFALLFLISQVEPLFVARYLLSSAPAMAIVGAIGLVALARCSRGFAAVVAVIVVCLAVAGRADLRSYGLERAEQSRDAARLILAEARPGDGVFPPRLSLSWQLERQAEPGDVLPSDFGAATDPAEAADLTADELPPDIVVTRLRSHPRVWLVRRLDSDDHLPIAPVLRSAYERILREDFGDLRVELYQRTPDR